MAAKVAFMLTASTPARHDVCGAGWSRLSSRRYFFPEWNSLNITSWGASSGLKPYQVGRALCVDLVYGLALTWMVNPPTMQSCLSPSVEEEGLSD